MKSTEVRTKILVLLPVYQQDAWRKLGLEHRQISKVVRGLEAEGLLVRTRTKGTFYLEITHPGKMERKRILHALKVPVTKRIIMEKPVPIKKEHRFAPLLSGGIFSPCTGCSAPECEPTLCGKLSVWVAG